MVTGICDPNKSQARHHQSLKLGSKLKYLKMKKNNFEINLKSQNRKDAILRFKEQQILNQGVATCEQTETVDKESSNSGALGQTLLKPMI